MNLSIENSDERSSSSSALYLNFSFFKIDQKWRWLNDIGKEEAAKEFSTLIDVANTKMKVRTYSTIGLRHDSEFMIWSISSSLENIQVLTTKIYSTILGKYLEPTCTFLSLTRKSIYLNQVKLGFENESDPPLKYVIVYPFIKSREWYLLPFEKRKQMMMDDADMSKGGRLKERLRQKLAEKQTERRAGKCRVRCYRRAFVAARSRSIRW